MSATAAGRVLSYLLACVYALLGEVNASVAQLEIGRLAGKLPPQSDIATDADLDAVRDTPAFQAWWKQLIANP